jgi:hypothetical protein
MYYFFILLLLSAVQPHLKCDQCEMRFFHMSALERHYKTHTGLREHVCNVCSAAFARQDTMRLHQRQHSGEKPFVCSVCGMMWVMVMVVVGAILISFFHFFGGVGRGGGSVW